MPLFNIAEAKAGLSWLVDQALHGEEIIIARRNVPLVRLVVVEARRPRRELGTARGQIELTPDFDEALDDFTEYT